VNLSASEIRSLLTAETSAEIAEHFTSPQKKTVTLFEKYDLVYGNINGNSIVSIISRKDALDAAPSTWDEPRGTHYVIFETSSTSLATTCFVLPKHSFVDHGLPFTHGSEDSVGEIGHPNGQPLLESELVDVT